MEKQNVWLITGTSTGMGRALAETVVARGDKLVATVRTPGVNQDLVEQAPDRVSILQLDVTQPEQIHIVVTQAQEQFGRIDVLVNNAGYGLSGAVEELTEEQIRRQIETNLIGSILLTRAVVPLMRAHHSGHIIQIASMGGQIAFPGLSLYHATKWGIEGFCEALAKDVASFGIQVTIVEPGAVRTDFSGRSMEGATPLDAYAQTSVGQVRQVRQKMSSESMRNMIPGDPAKVAEAIMSIADQPAAPLRLTLGSDAYQQVRVALQTRLAALEAQEALARSTDADDTLSKILP
jgi:NAD(P)-dependent dehydrogenase (short-subunit alcohol dehydrogenase family)